MNVCIHVCMYVRTYVCIYVCMYAFMYTYGTSCGEEIGHGVIEQGGTLRGNICIVYGGVTSDYSCVTQWYAWIFLSRSLSHCANISLYLQSSTIANLRVFTLGKRRCTWLSRKILRRQLGCCLRPRPTATSRTVGGIVSNLLIPLLSITVSCRVYAYTASYLSIRLLSYANSSFVVSFSVYGVL